jgi:hypothetical protein
MLGALAARSNKKNPAKSTIIFYVEAITSWL